MAESYREMEARHDELDRRIYRQEFADRWAGPPDYVEVAEENPPVVRNCTNCRYAEGGVEVYWCKAMRKDVVGGTGGCSGWPWDPKDES